MLRYLPVNGGVSSIPITKTIVSGETLYYKRHLEINIGQYFQVNEQEDPSNSQVPCTKGAFFPWTKWKLTRGVLIYDS